jgi:hypothetical protein
VKQFFHSFDFEKYGMAPAFKEVIPLRILKKSGGEVYEESLLRFTTSLFDKSRVGL